MKLRSDLHLDVVLEHFRSIRPAHQLIGLAKQTPLVSLSTGVDEMTMRCMNNANAMHPATDFTSNTRPSTPYDLTNH